MLIVAGYKYGNNTKQRQENIFIEKENKTLIGGNFVHWYGGFQSYVVGHDLGLPMDIPSMHCKRINEELVPNLTHLPYMTWIEWINHIRKYRFAVHLMPTVAAGTFALNCAIHGIPCIGNVDVDTQGRLYPETSVPVDDIYTARFIAGQLRDNQSFYDKVSHYAQAAAWDSFYVDKEKWSKHMLESLIL